MKDKIEIFVGQVEIFFKRCLSKNDYAGSTDQSWLGSNNSHTLHFFQEKKKLQLNISLTDFEDGRFFLYMAMHKDERGLYGDKKHFSLSDYIEDHSISNFPEVCEKGEDFESFTKNYFQNLTTACETYLHDQISGASFEEHDPAPGRV